MDIYVVQPGDDIFTIAHKFGVTVQKLIQDNELDNPNNLVIGQTIVIVYPERTHTVQQGDTLNNIAAAYGVTLMQLLRNNPYLSGRKFIYPGETITIDYHTIRQISTNGFSYPYIKRETLVKTLPSLTYLSIFNYKATGEGEIIAYSDDSEIIRTAKDYGVVPLMMTATLSPTGEPDIETAYSILLNEEYQENHINNILAILKEKGYYGLNMTFNYLNKSNQSLYENFIKKVSGRLQEEGYLYFTTFNINIKKSDNEIIFDKVDYTGISQSVHLITLMRFIWGTNYDTPAPVSSIDLIKAYLDYAVTMIPTDKLSLGKPLLSYDWLLPYEKGRSSAYSLSIDSALKLAGETDSAIQFDETSQTPYFYYNRLGFGTPAQHIVWSIDARSIDALDKLIIDYNLRGTGIWNIMVYYPQMWLIVNSQFDTIKVIPDNLSVIY